ncbi:homoserine kinase [Sphingomonas sp. KR1UV-12]|uniref:Homoserine kinase n=1 Tax=Sphingomonas aurea TaxID=3063994 RepID=A0ABT9EG96_9SPHN|nr:homoserine kinase [Sphingomonas sp. KR1UV-12]MDP1025801.1 homoserine kinase [Sphingomonas sp. KR1UV-12]
MAVYTQVSAEALADFLSGFNVGALVSAKGIAEGVENSNYLVDTDRDRFILTLYEKRVAAGDLPFFLDLLDHVAAKGLPVPPAVPDLQDRVIHELQGRPACLIRFLTGVSVSHPSAAQAEAAASALGRLHGAVGDFTGERPNTMGVEAWRPLFERCGRALDQIAPGLHDDLAEAIDHVVARWPGDALDRSVIHADLFPDNVLMLGEAVTGLIDFYFACTDIRAYDLAIMHTAWSFRGDGRGYDAGVGDALLRGYETHFPLSAAERAHFTTLASGACIRFALSRAWDWLNTPADALVTRKDPLAYMRRLHHYDPVLATRTA